MSTEDETNTHLPNPPRKLADHIKNQPEDLEQLETIIGNGAIKLTTGHPVSVVEYFLGVHVDEWSVATYEDYSYDLTRFLEYCDYAEINDLAELSKGDLTGFKQWRKRDENVGLATLHGQLANIRVFIRGCEDMEVVEEGLADKIVMPDIDDSDIVSYTRLDPDTASQILEYHGQADYVTREFAEFALMWGVLLRLGDVRSLDLCHYNRREGYIDIEHNPEEGTPLKNGESEVEGEGGERQVNLPDWICDILNSYIDGTGDPNHPKRIDIEDDYSRKPLFTTKFGRVSESTLRRDLYRITQPCRYGEECPHDMDPSVCEARNDNDVFSKCPSNVSPHPIRRGGICHQLKEGVLKDTICGEADLSLKVLNKHYDLRTKEEARKQRREELRNHLDGYEDPLPESEKDLSYFQREFPLFTNLAKVTEDFVPSSENLPSQARLAKGIAGYSIFVFLIGLNFALLLGGLNPLA